MELFFIVISKFANDVQDTQIPGRLTMESGHSETLINSQMENY